VSGVGGYLFGIELILVLILVVLTMHVVRHWRP
jgi:hypothetical protein